MTFLPAVVRVLRAVVFTLLLLCAGAVGATAASAAEISGVAFKDLNRDGVKQAAEEPLAGKEIYAFDSTGRASNHAPTDGTGRYVIPDVPPGTYSVRYGTVDWWALRQDWAPSTTGGERPWVTVQVTDAATANFGWRPIIRSTDVNAPISSYVAASGLKVKSYNDVVVARSIYETLAQGSLHAAEAASTTIHFDLSPTNYCSVALTSIDDGPYTDFDASCHISYLDWLNLGDVGLFHEYGHAWSQYHAYMVQQDPGFGSYLEARGLAGDPRVGTSEQWSPKEMIAEDYRQLFGTPNAAAGTQANRDIPPASSVPGLREFLSGPFMLPPASPPPPPPPPPPPAEPTMQVGSFIASAARTNRGWTATASVTIRDASQQPVGGAAVSLRWSNAKTGSSGQIGCITHATGGCSASVDLSTKVDSVSLAVASVVKDGMRYASSAGGAVTVKRPR